MTRKDRIRRIIFGTVEDLVSEFLYYGRKEDEDLDAETLEKAIRDGWITVDEVAAHFAKHLREDWLIQDATQKGGE